MDFDPIHCRRVIASARIAICQVFGVTNCSCQRSGWNETSGSQISPIARQLVRQDGWQAAIFGGRNRPSLLMVAHQLASASEVTSS